MEGGTHLGADRGWGRAGDRGGGGVVRGAVGRQLVDPGLGFLELGPEDVDEDGEALYLVSHDGHGGGGGR